MNLQRPVYLAFPLRTAIGKFGGALRDLSAPALGTTVAMAVLQKSGLPVAEINQVIFGHARQAGNGPNPARQVAVRSGIPHEVPAFTVNQACNSGLLAILQAAQAVASGDAEVVLAGGMEAMSKTPYYLDGARWGSKFGHQEITDGMTRDGFQCPMADMLMGETAEILAREGKISRQVQDEFALRSQQGAKEAIAAGRFQAELVPVKRGAKTLLDHDEHPRPESTIESLRKLPPTFSKTGTIHPGNASGITDGAAALLVMSEKAAKKVAKREGACLVRIIDASVVGLDPKRMGLGPVPAVEELLKRQKKSLSDIDLVEINEAFAAQVLACDQKLHFDWERTNVNGGAIALGHPIGATGARIVVTLMHEMSRRSSKLGLATLCVSGGLGAALLVEHSGSIR